ncbi:hypothetical protein P0Y35_13995 [Kiritimatiellaeota bacterium B1221]|nr:hypothetical protein [Kiritimatiellaeota bacterium B1221]
MKRVAILVDAAADLPYPELQDQTPMQQARLPFARELASEGRCGALKRLRPEADASRALLAEFCGVPEAVARDLRWGPMAAASLGLPVSADRVYILAGFVSIDEHQVQMPVHPSSLEEQQHLLEDLQKGLSETDGRAVELHSLSLGRFVIMLQAGEGEVWPRTVVQYGRKSFLKRLPARLTRLLQKAEATLKGHPVNTVRLDLGEAPVDGLWCWSGGANVVTPDVQPFRQALVTQDPLAEGMAKMWKRTLLQMENPYNLSRPDAGFDVFQMMQILENHDEVVIWVPAPFSSRKFEGSSEKVRRLDAVDYYVSGPVKAILEEMQPSRLLLLAAGVRHRGRPERGAAPFVLWGEGIASDSCQDWTEIECTQGSLGSPKVKKLLEIFRKET